GWAVVKARQGHPVLAQQRAQPSLNIGKRVLGKEPARHARLIGDDNQAITSPMESSKRGQRALGRKNALRIDVIWHVLDQGAILVEKYGSVPSGGLACSVHFL